MLAWALLNNAKRHRCYCAWAPGLTMAPVPFYRYRSIRGAAPCLPRPHVDPDRVVHDPVHDRVRMDPAAEPRVRSFFLNWVQKTVEAVSYLTSISSNSIDLNSVFGLSSSRSSTTSGPNAPYLRTSFSGLHGNPDVTGMLGRAFNGGAERQYLPGWTAVPIRNLVSA